MEARQERGKQIAETLNIVRKGAIWLVPSSSGNGKYTVSPDAGNPHCSCPDHESRGVKCKHIFAVEIVMSRTEEADGTVTETKSVTVSETIIKKPTYKQDWPNYDLAQTREKDHFLSLLSDLCSVIPAPTPRTGTKGGRPAVPLSVDAFVSIFKVFCGMSSRRFVCDMKAAHECGHLPVAVSYSSVTKAMENTALTPILMELIQLSAAPLAEAESKFAVDSSGFCMNRYTRWFDVKYGVPRKEHDWVKVHIVTGVKTNVVCAAEIHDKNTNDCNVLPSLIATTAKQFKIDEVSADKAYAANPNFDAVAKHGGTLYTTFRKNTTGGVGGLYEKMFLLMCLNREDYLKHYHARSNVESTFSAVKRKFGEWVKSKTDVASKNEVYCKMICHNISCLIHAMYELGLPMPTWKKSSPETARPY